MNDHTVIIAEAGVNHNGSFELACRMVDDAAACGVDYVKFQTFKAGCIVSASAARAEYQQRNMGGECSQLEMLRKLELTSEQFAALREHCLSRGIGFMSTPFDIDSIGLLTRLGVDCMKVPSGEITNLPYLRCIAATGLPVIMSTGMSTLGEVEQALGVLVSGGIDIDDITLLHCNTEYPTPMSDVNLRAMITLKAAFGTRVGYSDHTPGIEVPVAAVALGAAVIEKHFTLDRTMPGPDHAASLEPAGLAAMVHAIRNVETALGSGRKLPSPSEIKNRDIARKSITAATDIACGQIFTPDNITVKRPGTGVSPMRWDEVVGRRACRDFKADQPIEL